MNDDSGNNDANSGNNDVDDGNNGGDNKDKGGNDDARRGRGREDHTLQFDPARSLLDCGVG